MKKHIIYESTGYWTTETWEDAVNYYKQAYGEIDEQQILEMIYDDCNRAFEDERVNLNQQINGPILVIANIGRWNGRFSGYKIIDNNLKEILSNFGNVDEIVIFSDGKNIRAEGCHHDGTNYYLFREIKDGVNIDKLLNDIYYNKKITSARLSYYTKSLVPYVNNIYGWK